MATVGPGRAVTLPAPGTPAAVPNATTEFGPGGAVAPAVEARSANGAVTPDTSITRWVSLSKVGAMELFRIGRPMRGRT